MIDVVIRILSNRTGRRYTSPRFIFKLLGGVDDSNKIEQALGVAQTSLA